MSDEASVLASEAFVFGFPLVFNLEQCIRFTTIGVGRLAPIAFNTFGHARSLAGPGESFVSVNNDTLYSVAIIDLSAGPLLLTVPEARDRYHVLQFVDAWTNNFAYIGTHTTGGAAGEHLLVPPGWTGEHTGAVIRIPTTVAVIVGRWACDGEEDAASVHRLQDALGLRPVQGPDEPTRAPAGIPPAGDGLDEPLAFFEKLRVWSQAFPPSPTDALALQTYAAIGLTGSAPLQHSSTELQDALRAGYFDGKSALEGAVSTGQGPMVNNWILDVHAFDYNVDVFGPGTIDSPEWKHPDAATRYAMRAAAARSGLWGNHGYEAAYAVAYSDASDEQLSGDRVYCLRLHPTPPVDAFWSLTMYDLPGFHLVENELGRYSVGDRTRGIVFDDDGGLDITMSSTRPADPRDAANWLPTPPGPFRPILRMYGPGPGILEGRYELPPIERIG